MSKLDELIRELCPDGVEYKRLEECCTLVKGKTPIQKAEPGEYPLVVTASERRTCSTYQFDKPTVCIPLISSRGHGVASLNSVYYQEGKFALGNILCGVTPKDEDYLSAKFLFEYLNYKKDTLLVPLMKGGANVSMTVDSLKRVSVPVPPMQVQMEVVQLLYKFTELSESLKAELVARQKQYEYYRSRLLTFDVRKGRTINFCQRTLGEMFDFRNGLSKGKEFFEKGTPFIRYTDVYNHRTLRKKDITALVECTEDEKERLKVSRGDVLFTRTSETAEDIGWSSVMLDDMDDCVFNGFTIKATPKTKELLPEYCAYCFSTSDFRQYVTKHCAFTTRASLTGNTIAQYRMTIPPLDIQSRIVNVLDNFEKICSDLNIGLPAEIEARQKQYEYYRDKLLTFAETGNTILSRAEQSRAEQSRAELSRAEQSRAEQSRAEH